jgi:predicted dehydrogenase
MPAPVRFAVVGHGWRADFYLRLARLLPDRFTCTGVLTRRTDVGERLEREWGVRTTRDLDDLLSDRPQVVVTSVPVAANPDVVRALVERGATVLSETPPAPDVEGLRALWRDVGDRDRVQVAEQHPSLPVVAAVRALLDRGLLGQVSSASVSWTHDYHAVALLRSVLGLGAQPVAVQAVHVDGPLLEPPGREGRPVDPQVVTARHTTAVLTCGSRTGVYDFTDGQWFSSLRRRQLAVRGSHGEVVGTDVRWARDDGTVLAAPLVRRQTGFDGDLEGADLDAVVWAGEVLFANPNRGARLSDEEIAIARCLEATARWRAGDGPPPYPLADACQDALLGHLLHRAAERGTLERSGQEAWAAHVLGPG